jgi:hypothetical protein
LFCARAGKPGNDGGGRFRPFDKLTVLILSKDLRRNDDGSGFPRIRYEAG